MKSIGTVGNRLGLYTVTVWRVGRLRRLYRFDCDVCDLASARRKSSQQAWSDARVHADLHASIIRDAVGLCVARTEKLGGTVVFCKLRSGHAGMHESNAIYGEVGASAVMPPMHWTERAS